VLRAEGVADAAAAQLEAGNPPWLAGPRQAAIDASTAWLAWYRTNVAPMIALEDDSWIPERLEHRFSRRIGSGQDHLVLRAPAFEGGVIDWHAFDAEPGATLDLANEPAPPGSGCPRYDRVGIPAALRRYALRPVLAVGRWSGQYRQSGSAAVRSGSPLHGGVRAGVRQRLVGGPDACERGLFHAHHRSGLHQHVWRKVDGAACR